MGGFRKLTQARIDALFDETERRGLLLSACVESRGALRRRLRAGDLVSPVRGLYARSSYWENLGHADQMLHIIRTEASRHPAWAFRSYSAALVWELDVPEPLLDSVQIIASSPRMQIAQMRRPLPSDEIVVHNGIRVTSFWQTVIESLCTSPFSYGLAIADSALRQKGLNRMNLLSRSEHIKRRGIKQARFIASYADGRAENGGESRARAFFIANGYPLPELQKSFIDPTDTSRVYRADFYWELSEDLHVIGEFDGLGKYRDPSMLRGGATFNALINERQRESRLTLLGMPVLRFTYDDLQHPANLRNLLAAAGIPQNMEAAQNWHRRWTGIAQ